MIQKMNKKGCRLLVVSLKKTFYIYKKIKIKNIFFILEMQKNKLTTDNRQPFFIIKYRKNYDIGLYNLCAN